MLSWQNTFKHKKCQEDEHCEEQVTLIKASMKVIEKHKHGNKKCSFTGFKSLLLNYTANKKGIEHQWTVHRVVSQVQCANKKRKTKLLFTESCIP